MKVTFENWEATGKVASEDGKKEGFGGNSGFIRLNPTESDRSIFQFEPHTSGPAKKTAINSHKQRLTNQSALNQPIPPKTGHIRMALAFVIPCANVSYDFRCTCGGLVLVSQ
ncbi:MAG TPA: hypothetical protein VK815_01965 [Candidatus Acidoferrales bacterium]|nr:hypothetical protein [Candidatus Acidoferrales bacterium]